MLRHFVICLIVALKLAVTVFIGLFSEILIESNLIFLVIWKKIGLTIKIQRNTITFLVLSLFQQKFPNFHEQETSWQLPWAGFLNQALDLPLGATSRALLWYCKSQNKARYFYWWAGAISVESLWKGATNHERLRTTDVELRVIMQCKYLVVPSYGSKLSKQLEIKCHQLQWVRCTLESEHQCIVLCKSAVILEWDLIL